MLTGTLEGNGTSVDLTKGIYSGNLFTFYADHSHVIKAPDVPPGKLIFRGLGSVNSDDITFAMFADEKDFILDIKGTRSSV